MKQLRSSVDFAPGRRLRLPVTFISLESVFGLFIAEVVESARKKSLYSLNRHITCSMANGKGNAVVKLERAHDWFAGILWHVQLSRYLSPTPCPQNLHTKARTSENPASWFTRAQCGQ